MKTARRSNASITGYELVLMLLPLFVFMSCWHLLTDGNQQRQFVFSSPHQVFDALVRLTMSGELLRNLLVTVFEAFCGFILGTTTGAIIGLSLWYSRIVAKIAQPYITALATVPIFVLAPIVIFWFGIGLLSKVMLAFMSTVAVAIVQSYQGAMSVEERSLRLMKVLGANRLQTFRIVVVPSALIWVINAMKLNVGLALLGAFIGEFISAEEGLGYMIVKASGVFDMATVYAGVFVLIVVALILNFLVELLEKRLLRWKMQST
jgi:NitT/TauT family transport system permease protein